MLFMTSCMKSGSPPCSFPSAPAVQDWSTADTELVHLVFVCTAIHDLRVSLAPLFQQATTCSSSCDSQIIWEWLNLYKLV